ncbi:MAG TPA: hypothetical protein VGG48_10955 [Rhizomicrobium sp.]|jgi:hypothetical protein
MQAFDYIITLLSFVYALAIAHLLTTIAELVRARRRVRFSWLNAAWMLIGLLTAIAWWIGMWDMRGLGAWSTAMIGFLFAVAFALYLQIRFTCPDVPAEGEVDLPAFHRDSGRDYIAAFAVVAALTVAANLLFGEMGSVQEMITQNLAVVPMLLIAVIAAISFRPWVQIGAAIAELLLWAWYFATLQSALR